jgi:hypothetical protein
MFGGTDDSNELNDFWALDLTKNEWRAIESLNGPSPRSGCRMVFDVVGNQLFVIGRKSMRGNESLKVSHVDEASPIESQIRIASRATFIFTMFRGTPGFRFVTTRAWRMDLRLYPTIRCASATSCERFTFSVVN